MTSRILFSAAAAAAITGIGAMAVAQSDVPYPVQARQGQFTLMQLNVGVLVEMVRGNTEYDAARAQAAANNLVAISSLDQSFHWPEGTDNTSISGTRALPAIWENLPDVVSKWQDFGTASVAMAAVAGDGLDGMREALGPLGATCGACHDAYRAPQ